VNFFVRVRESITDFGAYKRFAAEPFNKAFGYLALLVLVLGLPFLIYTATRFHSGINKAADLFRQSCPDFTFENGELTVHAAMPIIIQDGDSYMVVDTTGGTDEGVLEDYESGMFLSQTRAVIKQNRYETREVDLSQLKELTVTKADVEEWLPGLKAFSVFIVVFGLVYMLSAKLLGAVIMGLICLLLATVQKAELTYGSSIAISIYALTLPTVFQTLQKIFLTQFPHPGLVYYVVLAMYLWFAVRANKSDDLTASPIS
jgi:hypothetical protein